MLRVEVLRHVQSLFMFIYGTNVKCSLLQEMLSRMIERECPDVPFQSRTTAFKYMNRFCSSVSILDNKKIFRRGNEENLEKIGVRLEKSPTASLVQLAQQMYACIHACVHVHYEQEMQ